MIVIDPAVALNFKVRPGRASEWLVRCGAGKGLNDGRTAASRSGGGPASCAPTGSPEITSEADTANAANNVVNVLGFVDGVGIERSNVPTARHVFVKLTDAGEGIKAT